VQSAMARDAVLTQALCADHQGFSLHAGVRCDAHERRRLEQLCRTITRPALANERVQINSAGQVALKLKPAWRDGTTHIVMSPALIARGQSAALELVLRLARPRTYCWRIRRRPLRRRLLREVGPFPLSRPAGRR